MYKFHFFFGVLFFVLVFFLPRTPFISHLAIIHFSSLLSAVGLLLFFIGWFSNLIMHMSIKWLNLIQHAKSNQMALLPFFQFSSESFLDSVLPIVRFWLFRILINLFIFFFISFLICVFIFIMFMAQAWSAFVLKSRSPTFLWRFFLVVVVVLCAQNASSESNVKNGKYVILYFAFGFCTVP